MRNAYKTSLTKPRVKIPGGRHKWNNNIEMEV
jgi:hypothetical protein